MRKSILLSVLCFFLSTIVYSQDWVTFTKTTPEEPIIELIGSNNQQVEFNVEVCGMYKTDITDEGEPFQRIEVTGAGKTTESGSPELPYIRQLIAIPECDDVVLTMNITGQTDFNNYNIYPAPGYEEVEEPGGAVYMQEVFYKDETIYAQNTYFTGMNAEIVSTGYLRDQKYAEVFLYPIQFNPVLKHIDVFTHFQITLDFINPTTPVNVNTGIFNNVATNTMLNYVSSGITASINDNVQGNGNVQWIELTETSQADNIVADYLIICAEHFFEPNEPESEVLRIANHRATYNGFDVAIINANTVISDELDFFYEGSLIGDETYKKEQRIRTCIRRIYEGANAQHTYDGKLGYVLLIGDSEYGSNLGMPTSYMYTYEYNNNGNIQYINYASDYHFACITKQQQYDPVGDVFVGRFCVDNNVNGDIELENMVSKTIFYESEYIFDDWRNNVVFSNGYDDNWASMFTNYYSLIEETINEPYNLDIYNSCAISANAVKMYIIQSLNDGSFFKFYNGHGGFDKWYIQGLMGIEKSDFDNYITNENKYPVTIGLSCYTGYFDEDEDCFAEFTTSYANKGFVGYLGSSRINFTGLGQSLNHLGEWIPFSIFNNLSHVSGEFILESKNNSVAFYEKFGYNYFGDPALNLMASGFEVTQNTNLPQNTTISSEIKVRSGATLNIPGQGKIYFENIGRLIIEEGATIVIGNNSEFIGNNLFQSLIINGNLIVQPQGAYYLSSQEGTIWGGISFNNNSKEYSISNFNFENCYIKGECKKMIINNCAFTNSGILISIGNLRVTNSILNNSNIEAKKANVYPNVVEVLAGTTIHNYSGEAAILIDGYDSFEIDNCIISGNSGDGIRIYNSGNVKDKKAISNNTIIDNGFELVGSGIEVYRSYVQIYGDQLIEGNKYGISCFNNSNVSIRGNSEANYVYETQIIRDNEKHQIYSTQNSFPYDFHWNAIIDEDNQYPLVYHSTSIEEELKVSNNYWGESFNPENDLYPSIFYIYVPIWELNDNSGGEDDAETMYNSAHEKIAIEDYSGAKLEFQQIINDYPSSQFAQASLRELFSIEEYISDDYAQLKTYYSSEDNIQNNPELAQLAEYLSNFCEIKLENYPTAIAWFENIIQNPENIEDSIFAIIDLGYTYFLMDNGGLKSVYSGALTEYIPESKKQFDDERDYLLSLLYRDSQINDSLENKFTKLNDGELLQNFPNPFSGNTKIWYTLENESRVHFSIYNYTGQLVYSFNEGTKKEGKHYIDFDATGLKNGIYYYSLNINGQTTDSKKMTIMK